MKVQLLAIPLLLALMMSPMAASAVTGTVSFTSPTSGASYSGTQSYAISGSISPAPTLPDNVAIAVTNPGGQVVDFQQEAVQAGGSWTTYNTNVGGNPAQWTTGTYTITVSDSNGATGSTTFKYGATPSATAGYVTIEAPSLLLQGQSGNIFIWSSAPGSVTAWVLAPGATTTTALTTTRVSPNPGGLDVYTATYSVAAAATTGTYLVGASVTNSTSGFSGSNIGSFTVNGGVATSSQLTIVTNDVTGLAGLGTNITKLSASITALSSSVSAIATNVNTIASNVNSLSTAVSSLTTSVSSLSSTLGTINTNVQSLGTSVTSLSSTVSTINTNVGSLTTSISTLTTDVTSLQSSITNLGNLSQQMTTLQTSVTNLNSSVSNSQTYILVVAALAVITLVLELAILIRKLS